MPGTMTETQHSILMFCYNINVYVIKMLKMGSLVDRKLFLALFLMFLQSQFNRIHELTSVLKGLYN